jgi:hypothetical protein
MGKGLVWPRTGTDITMAKLNICALTVNRFLVLRPIASRPVELSWLAKTTTRNKGGSDVDDDENDDNDNDDDNNIIQDGRSRVRIPKSLNFFQFA